LGENSSLGENPRTNEAVFVQESYRELIFQDKKSHLEIKDNINKGD
jgi:hypothetical protein